ncbi:12918_t:CDS:1, partial [Dentiscutata heterogama]
SFNKAALEWYVGGPFYPEIEMTYVAYDKNTFRNEYDGRLQTSYITYLDLH